MGNKTSQEISGDSDDANPHQSAESSSSSIQERIRLENILVSEGATLATTLEDKMETDKVISRDDLHGAANIYYRDNIDTVMSKLQQIRLENSELRYNLARVERENMVTVDRLKRENMVTVDKLKLEKDAAEKLGIVKLSGMLFLAGIAALTIDYFTLRMASDLSIKCVSKRNRPLLNNKCHEAASP